MNNLEASNMLENLSESFPQKENSKYYAIVLVNSDEKEFPKSIKYKLFGEWDDVSTEKFKEKIEERAKELGIGVITKL